MDPKRETYRQLMAEIEALEEQVENFVGEAQMARQLTNSENAALVEEQLALLRMRLAEKRGELERMSDGCGKPHLW